MCRGCLDPEVLFGLTGFAASAGRVLGYKFLANEMRNSLPFPRDLSSRFIWTVKAKPFAKEIPTYFPKMKPAHTFVSRCNFRKISRQPKLVAAETSCKTADVFIASRAGKTGTNVRKMSWRKAGKIRRKN